MQVRSKRETKYTHLILVPGVGGLSSAIALAKQGFTVTIFEAASSVCPLHLPLTLAKRWQIGEVGAGINISPNVARVLDSWDLLEFATQEATLLQGVQVLDAESNQVLSKVDYSYIKQEFGYPFIVRASPRRACEARGEPVASASTRFPCLC